MDIKPFLAGMPLGPISGVASILMGAEMSQRRREQEQAAKDLEERRKVEMKEVEGYASKGNHAMLQQAYDSGMYTALPQDYRDRSLFRAGTYSNQQIALDADTASKAGFQPYMGTPQQMQQAMAMTGQPGAPQGMTPQPPPMMAQQVQAALPPGAPGQAASSMEMMPQIGGAPPPPQALPPTATSQGGQVMTPESRQFTPIQAAQEPQFDYQGRPMPPQPQADLIPQPIREEPIVMGQRKQFGPGTQPLALKFPVGIRPGKASVEGPLGTVPGKGEELQNSTAISQTMVDQAKGMGMSPDQLDAEYAKQIAKSGGNYPAFDETIRKTYKQEYFQKLAQDKTRALVAAGLPEPQAQQQGARLAADTMGGYYPEGAGQLVNYTPEERHRNVIGQATKQVMIQARAAMDASRPGEPATIQPGLFRKYVEEAFGTDGTPQEKEAALNDVTNMAMTTFRDKIGKLPGMTQAQAMIMSMQAAAGLAGYTPKEWQPMIMANAQAFGITDPDIAQMVATGEIDLLQPGSLQAGITKKNALAYEGKIREKGMERQFAVTQTPEGVAATQQALTTQPSAPPAASPGAAPVGAGSPAAPSQTPGEIDRAIKTQQVAAETEAKEKVQKQYRLAPEKEIQDVRALDDMYTKGTRLLQIGEGTPDKPGLIDRYGNYPGTFFDWTQSIKSATGTMDPDLKEYVNTLSGLFNIEKKEFTGTATSLNERKDLVAWIPDKSTNVRDALQSVSQLVKSVSSDLKRNTEHIASNYPGTDLSSLKYNQIQQRRLARQQQQGTQPPLATAPPPPPTPPTPAPEPSAPAPAPAQSSSLPSISEQADRTKAAHPSKATPKFGPGSTKAAAALVPNEIQQSLTPQDKGELHTAMKQYSRGQIDDKQLELAVAKVLMRAGTHSGKKNLEGPALNKAVAAWTEVLRRGAKSKKEFARGQ
ncbi:MAG TPA: hypothetical protein PK614_05085 [Nitrospira sp.]|nr:hypothetical protein [Nitrospira sp.]